MATKAKEKYKSIFNIAVLGLSGTEQSKGSFGVGKSCLCNRFVRERSDDYYPEHTSVLSQSDFGGRVVNNDHFLYWGEITKEDDSGIPYKFNVIEQTEFVDDQSYQPHRSSSNQSYFKRCAQAKLSSAEKMMYICTDQLGIESDFEQKPMPDGKLAIDGFLLCLDVSLGKNRTWDDQIKFVSNCLHYLNKTKKPIVLVLTKCDDLVPPFVKEAEKFASGTGTKKGGLTIVETSAAENINVNLAFLVLAQMIDKARSKTKIVSFEDAAKAHKEILNSATEDLEKLLISVVKDYHETWMAARKTLEDKPEYTRYVELLGKNSASKVFRKHVNRLCDEYKCAIQADYLQYLPRALNVLLPNINSLRPNWHETMFFMMKNKKFNDWVIELQPCNSIPWYENNHINSLEDRRIPKELLQSVDAENMFLKHKHDLEVKQRREEMKLQFKDMLLKSTQVTPGKEWGEIVKYFKSHDFLSALTEAEVSTIYNQFQAEITEKAKIDFQELLYEQAEVFVSENKSTTQGDIHNALKPDPRYIAMDRLRKERDEILTRHITGLLYPNKDDWGSTCLEDLISHLEKSKPASKVSLSSQWQLKPDSKTLNVVLLGADGLSRELANEITVQSSDDEYTLDGHIHNLRLRSIDGDTSLLRNSFKTSSFSPHGCIAVYSSHESLQYIQRSLEKTVLPSNDAFDAPFQGLPVSILLATSSSESHKAVTELRSAGELLASRLGCPFIDVIEPEYAYNRRFHESQIKLAMRSLIEGIKERAGSSRNSAVGPDEESEEPDLRIVMCTMREDYSSSEVALLPLLRHFSYQPPNDPVVDEDKETNEEKDSSNDTVVVETYLGTSRRKISVTVTSYQSARHLLNSRGRRSVHGFILVYDTQRQGTFSVMKVFGKYTVSSYPLLFLCVSSSPGQDPSRMFVNDPVCNKMIVDGNNLADELQAKFMIATTNHAKQTEIYTTFFKEAWERKDQTEAINTLNQVVEEIADFNLKDDDTSETNSATQEDSNSRPITPEKPTSLNSLIKCTSASSIENLSGHEYSPTVAKTPFSRETPESVSSWIVGDGDEYANEVTSTSPTANLIDNEETPSFDFAKNEHKSSHAGPVPGKLSQDLVNMVEKVVRNPQKSFTEGMSSSYANRDTPYMSMFNPKVTGQRVLPQLEKKPPELHVDMASISSTPSPHNRNKFWHGRQSAPTIKTPHKNKKKNHEMDLLPLNDTTPEPRTRASRYSTAALLDTPTEPMPSVGMKKGISHELLSVLGASSTSPITSKEEKLNKQRAKEERKRRKENEDDRKKEKERLKENKQKDKASSKVPRIIAHPGIHGNHHNASAYFNQPLDNIIQGLNHMIPLFVEKCVKFIEEHGIATEGLYRIPANAKEREIIIKKFDLDNSITFYELETCPTVQTIAGCLTWFFSHKNLPEPLVPFSLNDDMEEAMGMPDGTVRNLSLRGVLRKLPPAHYVTFKYICTHLRNVCRHDEQNKMNSENLAICWWPTLFRPEVDISSPAGFGRSCFKDALLTCIVQCQFIFYDKPIV